MTTKWTFADAVLSTSYTFEINPNTGGSPARKKNITDETTTAPDGDPLVFEGQDPLSTGSFSGVVLSEDQYEAMELWFAKRHPIDMTDDLGRTFTIYIREFTPTRGWKISHPWRHTYEVTYVILDES